MRARNVRFVLALLGAAVLVGACSPADPPPEPAGPAVRTVVQEPTSHTLLLDVSDPAELALTASQQIFSRSPVVVLAAPAQGPGAQHVRAAHAAAAEALSAPALVVGDAVSAHGAAAELDRLGARVAVVVEPEPAPPQAMASDGAASPAGESPGSDPSGTPGGPDGTAAAEEAASAAGATVVRLDVAQPLPGDAPQDGLAADDASRLHEQVEAALAGSGEATPPVDRARLDEVLALTDPRPGQEAAIATLRAAGAVDEEVPDGDIASSPEAIDRIDSAQALAVVGVGPSFGDAAEFAWRVAAAERGDLLPTGDQRLLPGRYVTVGADGDDDPAEVVARAAATAESYAGLDGGPVVPTVVVPAGAAGAVPGDDGDWVDEAAVADLAPLVDAAREAGQYVLLDVPAGTRPLVEEVEPLADLLARPGVGVALHPEDRRSDGTTAPQQASVAEVQDAIAYIEGVVTNNGLPPAMVVIHQTRPESVVQREQLGTATASDAVEVVIAADRTGAMTTTGWVWGRVTDDLPDGVHAAWSGPTLVAYQSADLVPTDPEPLLVLGS
ncbi:hypothetical protein [Isoptericola aurantiacus]|uniref:hypothetical protein n=1 Tax=Isoptericola aurantiacus TaxID=3377839 RepID=UPI00383BE06A